MIHAIVTTWALDEAKKRDDLSNRCPKCGDASIASEKKEDKPVFCEKCGTELPSSQPESLEAEETGQNDK